MAERVLCLSAATTLCEEARYVRRLATGLSCRGHHVLCFAPEGGAGILTGGREQEPGQPRNGDANGGPGPAAADAEAGSGAGSLSLRRWWGFGARLASRLYEGEWNRVAAAFQPTVIHACGATAARPGRRLASALAVPLAVTVLGAARGRFERGFVLCNELAKLTSPWILTVPYGKLAEELRARTPQVRGRLEVIVPGVRAVAVSDRSDEVHRVPVVGMAAGLDGDGGVELLLRTAQCLRREGVGCEFLIVGEGSQEKRLRRLARRLGVRPLVNFVPPLADLVSALQELDVAAVVSRRRLRVLSILEAQAAARAVVATPFPGIEEFIEDGVTGIIPQDDSPDAVARGIEELIEDDELRLQIGTLARDHAVATADLDRMLERIERLYRRLHETDGSRSP